MRVYLDTEFNEFGGELISMALVSQNGLEWYEVRKMTSAPGEWVSEHVIPKLDKLPLESHEFRASFHDFISNFNGAEVIADWPADFEHFCEQLTGIGAEAGFSIPIECTMKLIRGGDVQPDNPHNALSDARALRDWHVGELDKKLLGHCNVCTNKFEEKAHEIVNAGYCGTCKTICGGHVICDTEELPCDDPYWMPLRDNDDLFISAISSALEEADAAAIEKWMAETEALFKVRTHHDIPESKRYCSFCGRGDKEIGLKNLVEGPSCCICGQCAASAVFVIENRSKDTTNV